MMEPGPILNIKTVFPGMGISIILIIWLLIFMMEILILVRQHHYIEVGGLYYKSNKILFFSTLDNNDPFDP